MCGKKNRTISQSLQDGFNISDTAIYEQEFGHTGRVVRGTEAKIRADEWASLTDRDKMLMHQVAEDLRDLLDSVRCLSVDSIPLFRGRCIRDGKPEPPSVQRMGPPPLNLPLREGRYNRHGEQVLYLADSLEGVRREMECPNEGTLWVIRFCVPIASLHIADFSSWWPSDHLITAVFSRAEMCKVPGRGPDNYVFSQTEGDLVSKRFDGMMVPGVRGAPGAHYRNVVLFHKFEGWQSWANPGEPPFLDSPTSPTLRHEDIAVAAYYLWGKDGRVHGRDQAHWFQAIEDLK
jgi:hypothetical protein